MKKWFLLVMISSLLVNKYYANEKFQLVNECNIHDLTLSVTECVNDLFNVTIDFQYEFTSDSFKITGNGNEYGHFAYSDLPIILENLYADCETDYEFVVTDLISQNCHTAGVIGIQCCECFLNMDYTLYPQCIEGEEVVMGWYIMGSNLNEGISVSINGQYIGNFEYQPNGEYIISFGNPGTEFFTVQICNTAYPDCCDMYWSDFEWSNPCFNCNIWSITADPLTCENGLFDVLINCEYENPSDSFRINGNGIMYGHFAFSDLPILLVDLEGDCETNYEFVITDLENPDCSAATDIGTICCLCQMSDLLLTTSDCIDNQYDLTMDFDVINPGNDYFKVWINGSYSGYYNINSLPLNLQIESSNSETDHVLICINDMPNCCIDGNIANPCYQSGGDCHIYDVVADVTTCENGLFNVLINCQHENTSDSFRIQGNGVMYGHWAYSDLPVLLEGLAANCETNYEFAIVDHENSDCHSATDVGVVCCNGECNISNLQLSTSDCINNNHHSLAIDFDVENPGNAYYEIWINGIYRGTYLISELPKSLEIENLTLEYDHVLICINDMPNCCIDGNIDNPCYQSGGDCHIYDVVADLTSCEDGLFNVLINCQHENTSDSFRIQGNGVMYGHWAYSDLPVLLEGLAANCETNYEFAIVDLENNDCHSATDVGVVCCNGECNISNLQLSTSDCINNNHHSLAIDFDVENPGNAYYEIWINGIYRGTYLISELPKSLEIENTTLEFDHVLICINDMPNCCIDGNIDNPCYQSGGDCHIYNVEADVTTCENGLFNVLINCQHENTSDSFKIQGNGLMYGHFAYSDLPVLLEGLAANCETNYEFNIVDLENNDCHKTLNYGPVCCENVCMITDLVLITSDCSSEEEYMLTIDFNYENNNSNYFDLWINGDFIGYFNLSILPFSVSIANNGNQYTNVGVCINDQPDCCADGHILNPCYNSGECNISEITTDVTVCEDSLFNVLIDFNHQNTSDSFRIQGNGHIYGHFAYTQLPILLEGLNADCETNYEFAITDLGFEGCHNSTHIGNVCCEHNSNHKNSLSKNDIYYLFYSNKIMLDLNDNLFDIVNISFYNLLGQKIDKMRLSNATGENLINVNNEDHIQVAKAEMIKDGKLIESKVVKIVR